MVARRVLVKEKNMFGSIFKLVDDVATIASTPIKIAADVAGAVTKPIAKVAKEISDEVRDALK
jgi:hypothetical protein